MEKVILNEYCSINSVKEEEGSNLIRIEGYACHFNVANKNGEIVHRGSFVDCLKEFKEENRMPIMNFNHNPDMLIGGWDSFEIKEDGLFAKGHLNKDVALVRDTVLPLIKSGDLRGLSTEGFTKWADVERMENGVLRLNRFMLMGVSLVALPADSRADLSLKNRMNKEKSLGGRGINLMYHF